MRSQPETLAAPVASPRLAFRVTWGRRARAVLRGVFVAVVVFAVLFPFYIALITSLQPTGSALQARRSLVLTGVTFDNYVAAFKAGGLLQHMGVTIVVGVGVCVLALGFGSLAAFALSRFRFRGRDVLARTILLVYMFPPVLLVVPLFLSFARLRMNDSLLALILTDTTFGLPFAIWMLTAFFDTVPRELDDAALIDGCSPLSVLFHIVLPASAPGLAATATFCFMLAWGEYLFALTFINTQDLQPITLAVYSLIGPYSMNPGLLMAASVLCSLVPVVLFLSAQRWIVRGLTAGALKG